MKKFLLPYIFLGFSYACNNDSVQVDRSDIYVKIDTSKVNDELFVEVFATLAEKEDENYKTLMFTGEVFLKTICLVYKKEGVAVAKKQIKKVDYHIIRAGYELLIHDYKKIGEASEKADLILCNRFSESNVSEFMILKIAEEIIFKKSLINEIINENNFRTLVVSLEEFKVLYKLIKEELDNRRYIEPIEVEIDFFLESFYQAYKIKDFSTMFQLIFDDPKVEKYFEKVISLANHSSNSENSHSSSSWTGFEMLDAKEIVKLALTILAVQNESIDINKTNLSKNQLKMILETWSKLYNQGIYCSKEYTVKKSWELNSEMTHRFVCALEIAKMLKDQESAPSIYDLDSIYAFSLYGLHWASKLSDNMLNNDLQNEYEKFVNLKYRNLVKNPPEIVEINHFYFSKTD